MYNCKSIFLNLTNLCNAHCKKCTTPLVAKSRGELSKEILITFLNMLEANQYYGTIRCGLGENLIYSNLEFLFNLLQVKAHEFRFDILTNGLAFQIEKDVFFSNPKMRWGITLDGMKQDDLIGLQFGIDIERVKNNIKKIKRRYPKCPLYLNYTLHNKNARNLLDFINFGIDLGISPLFVTPLKVFKNHNLDVLLDLTPDLSSSSFCSVFSQIENFAQKNNIIVNLPKQVLVFKHCSESNNYSPVIDIDGSVSFCTGQEHIKIGNIVDFDISSKWIFFKKNIEQRYKVRDFCSNCLTKRNLNKTLLDLPN